MESTQHAIVSVNDVLRFDHDGERLLDLAHTYLADRCAHTDDIKTAICQFYCIDRNVLASRMRIYEVANARQVFCYLAYRYTRLSLQAVGQKVGLKDHTTVGHAVRQIEKFIRTRPLIHDHIDLLRLKLLELTVLRRRQ